MTLHTVASKSTEQRWVACSNSWPNLPCLCDFPWASWRNCIKWPLSVLKFHIWFLNLFAKDSLTPLGWGVHRRVTENWSPREPGTLLLHLLLLLHLQLGVIQSTRDHRINRHLGSLTQYFLSSQRSVISPLSAPDTDRGRWATQQQQGSGTLAAGDKLV